MVSRSFSENVRFSSNSKMLRALILLLVATAALAVVFPSSFENTVIQNDSANSSKMWVLIVAGSNGYYNYRHQADANHAYHIMNRHGIPDSQIVVMQYDDIANDPENPTPGIIINHPNGSDVYKGSLKDYTGDTVTSGNFLNILTGNAAAMKGIGSGKVIASGPNDHIFVNFADHGAPGIVAFPNDELAATDLNDAIKKMFKNKQYGKMVLYFEACESGSMFDGLLPKNINAFATTASNPDESSYACYYDDLRQTYLGDVYSVNWMEDADKENLSKETLQAQFLIVQKETNTSHVEEYGDLTMGKLSVGEFMGHSFSAPIVVPFASKADAIPAENVYMTLLQKKVEKSRSAEEQAYWKLQVDTAARKRTFLMKTLKKIVDAVSSGPAHTESLFVKRRPVQFTAHSCLDAANKYFSKQCFSLAKNEYALFTAPRVFANACMDGIIAERLIEVMNRACRHQPVVGIH